MSIGAIAFTAIVVSGAEGLALILAFAWLVHHKRIMLAATPKPPQQAPAVQAQAVPETVRRLPA